MIGSSHSRRSGGLILRRSTVIVASLVGAVLVVTPSASGASDTDPKFGSPSGSAYGVPLEEARRDGAPVLNDKRRGAQSGSRSGGRDRSDDPSFGTTGGGDGGSGGGALAGYSPSPIRTENGFGSSSSVPGLAQASQDDGQTNGGGRRVAKVPDRGAGGRLPFGASPRGEGSGLAREATRQRSGTGLGAYLVLAAVALGGALAGLAVKRARRG